MSKDTLSNFGPAAPARKKSINFEDATRIWILMSIRTVVAIIKARIIIAVLSSLSLYGIWQFMSPDTLAIEIFDIENILTFVLNLLPPYGLIIFLFFELVFIVMCAKGVIAAAVQTLRVSTSLSQASTADGADFIVAKIWRWIVLSIPTAVVIQYLFKEFGYYWTQSYSSIYIYIGIATMLLFASIVSTFWALRASKLYVVEQV